MCSLVTEKTKILINTVNIYDTRTRVSPKSDNFQEKDEVVYILERQDQSLGTSRPFARQEEINRRSIQEKDEGSTLLENRSSYTGARNQIHYHRY